MNTIETEATRAIYARVRWFTAVAGLVLAAILMTAGPAWASSFGRDHIFVYDSVWWDGDVLEYDPAGNFVRSFRANLPDTYRMSGPGHLRWGPDGHLYQFGELDRGDGAGGTTGVLEWEAGGHLVAFHPTPEWLDCGGFAVLDNGNWAITSWDGTDTYLKEYARDFSESWDFTGGPFDNQGLYMHEGMLYNTQNHEVAVWDPASRTFAYSFVTSEDNNDLAVSAAGMVAVNFQWHDPNRSDYVEIFDSNGTWLHAASLTDNDLIASRGIGFLSDGSMLVASGYDLGAGVWDPKLAIYDSDFAFVGLLELDQWREPGSIAIGIPEPATVALLALGAIAALRRRAR